MLRLPLCSGWSSVREESSSNIGSSNSSPATKRRKTDFKDEGISEVGVQFPPPIAVWKMLHSRGTKPIHWLFIWLLEGPLLRIPHTDGSKTSSRDFNHRPQPRSLNNKILYKPKHLDIIDHFFVMSFLLCVFPIYFHSIKIQNSSCKME